MALIIKGNMPTFCERLTEDGNNMEYCRFACICESHNISTMAIPSDCPILGEMPDKHGRLKDESVIMDKIQTLLKERSWMYASHAQEIIDIIMDAPTVVEASK